MTKLFLKLELDVPEPEFSVVDIVKDIEGLAEYWGIKLKILEQKTVEVEK